MKEFPQTLLAFLLGFSVVIFAISYATNVESAQKIENIEKLYELKASLQTYKTIQETEGLIQNTQKLVDSLNTIK